MSRETSALEISLETRAACILTGSQSGRPMCLATTSMMLVAKLNCVFSLSRSHSAFRATGIKGVLSENQASVAMPRAKRPAAHAGTPTNL